MLPKNFPDRRQVRRFEAAVRKARSQKYRLDMLPKAEMKSIRSQLPGSA